jgi:hypothetical protein
MAPSPWWKLKTTRIVCCSQQPPEILLFHRWRLLKLKAVYVRLNKTPIEVVEEKDLDGVDYVVTSTNRRLEGIYRKNWWGFAGRVSVDSTLHQIYNNNNNRDRHNPNFLVQQARKALRDQQGDRLPDSPVDPLHRDSSPYSTDPSSLSSTTITSSHSSSPSNLLPFATCLITPAGPALPNVGSIIHVCVPRFPASSSASASTDSTTLPHAYVDTQEEAVELLRLSYQRILQTALDHHSHRNTQTSSSSVSAIGDNRLLQMLRDWLWSDKTTSDSHIGDSHHDDSHSGQQQQQPHHHHRHRVSIVLPAIGCGYNRYPPRLSAQLAFDAIHELGCSTRPTTSTSTVSPSNSETLLTELWIEIRFRDDNTFTIWQDEFNSRIPVHFDLTTPTRRR